MSNSLAPDANQPVSGQVTPRLAAFWQMVHLVRQQIRPKRVPTILQMSVVECGAASLAMILSYYGRNTRISECTACLGVGRDGVTAETIVKAAREYGLRTKAYSIQELDHFEDVPLPAIIHWEFNHFVVLEQWSPKGVLIVDPSQGRRKLTHDEFEAGFTGVVLTFEPGIHFERRSKSENGVWRNYLAYMMRTPGTKAALVQVLMASLILQVLGLAFPLLTKILVDTILPAGIENVMLFIGLGMLILVLSETVITYLRSGLLIYLRGRLDAQMMLGFFEHVLTLPFSFFQQRSSGDLLMRLSSNATLRETFTSQTISTILDGTLVIVYLAILLSQAPIYALLVLAIGLVQVVLLLSTTSTMHSFMQRDLHAQAESQSYLVEALNGIATLKASGAEGLALDHWSNLFFKHLNISLRRSHFSVVIGSLLSALGTLSPMLLLWVGAWYVLNGTLTLGTMFALNALGGAFLSPLSSLVSNGQQLQMVGAHLERIADVIEAEPEQETPLAQQARPLTGRLELNNVSFGYDINAPLILRDISVAIEPGQKVAIVGSTGSGKSTLAKLMLALYKPTSGQIYYDGQPLSALNYRSLRRQFGVVMQDSFLFNGSIRQNISMNNPNLSLEEVVQAAQMAAIHHDILQMPMGYETLVAEGGSGLSGGQRQRLSLARALANKPAILLLDEATSHLDVVIEGIVNQNLNLIGCTQIVIAHRLSTIIHADQILVLHQGEIVERGNHEELLALGGLYAQLIYSQMGAPMMAQPQLARAKTPHLDTQELSAPTTRQL
ncbi:MAG: peptidase domain-containing ABC transporter [Ardenticatenaceae bacterium]